MMHFPKTFPVPLIHLEETDSTNKYLNELCNKQCVEELTTITADFQTSGRGSRTKPDVQLCPLSHFSESPQTIPAIANHIIGH